MTGSLAYKIRGMIPFPCCSSEKIVVFEGLSGCSSNKCPRCRKYAIFDYNKMISEPTEAVRGASHRFRNK